MYQPNPTALFNRPDTLFGVCEGIGQDFGFNPNYLRVSLAVLVLWNPVVVIGTYLALGFAVTASRLLFPVRSARPVAKAEAAAPKRVAAAPANQRDEAPVALAA